jgi:predicted nuclease of restriction endonuclease-like (RecB) superfamily
MSQEVQKLQLINHIKQLIEQSKKHIATSINITMNMLYWEIGNAINKDVILDKRAEYGKQVVINIAHHLTLEYGASFSEKNLRKMMQFAENFPDEKIVAPLMRQLSWTHFLVLIPIKDHTKREFYTQMCLREGWGVRTFRERVKSMLYERTAISKKPELTIKNDLAALKKQNKLNPDLVFRDPYLLDFLGLSDTFSEKDLESAILGEMQRFIIELGSDFAFMARQKRINIDNRDYYIDLLFYHRRLKCLIAIELKIGEFEAAYKGQMELYLRYLEKYERLEGENQPIGLILCYVLEKTKSILN